MDARLRALEIENANLRTTVLDLRATVELERATIEKLTAALEAAQHKQQATQHALEATQRTLEVTQRALEAAQRAGKRQAAPFRKSDAPAAAPKKPGRKKGRRHGRHEHRAAPAPEEIDERYEAPLPDRCPHCGGQHLEETHATPHGLTDPKTDAATWRAEQAIRPAVVNRKVWGGNRTWRGATAQAILTSLLAALTAC